MEHKATLFADEICSSRLDEFTYDGVFDQIVSLARTADSVNGNWLAMVIESGDDGHTRRVFKSVSTYGGELSGLLLDMSVQGVGALLGGNTDLDDCIASLQEAAVTRLMYGAVQFEASWREPMEGGDYWVFYTFKLSPGILLAARGIDSNLYLNDLSWNLMLPDISALDDASKPGTAADYLALGAIDAYLEISEEYVPQQICGCLGEARASLSA